MTRWYQSTWFEMFALLIISTLLYIQVMQLIVIPLVVHFKDVLYGPVEGLNNILGGTSGED